MTSLGTTDAMTDVAFARGGCLFILILLFFYLLPELKYFGGTDKGKGAF